MTQVRVGWRAYVSPVGGSTGTDTDAQAFITAAAITDSVQISALNTLVTDLKTYGLWTKIKALYPFVGGSAASHKFNLKDPRDIDAGFRLQFNGGWAHSGTGAKPNGTTGYAETYLNNNILGLNNISFGVYFGEDNTISYDKILASCPIGAYNGGWGSGIYTGNNTSVTNYFVNNSNGALSINSGSSKGMYIVSKISTSSFIQTRGIFYNLFSFNTQTLRNATFKIGRAGDWAGDYNLQEQRLTYIGDGLYQTEISNLYTAIQKFQTTLGRHVGTPYVSDPDAVAFLTAAGITDSTQAAAINTLVIRMKADGVWTKMKAIYPFVGGTANSHKWNLKDPRDLDAAYRLVFNGGGTHNSTGYVPNLNSYADTKLNPSTVLNIDSIHFSYYSRTNLMVNNYDMGVTISSVPVLSLTAALRWGDGVTYYSMGFNPTEVNKIQTSTDKNFIFNKITTSASLFENTTKTTTSVTNRSGLPNGNFFIAARNLDGTAQQSPQRNCAFSSIGDGLTDAEVTAFYNAIQAYQTTLGRQVNVPLVSDTDAQAFLDAANIISFQQASAVNKLVIDLKAAGVWTKMKAIYPFVGGSAATHKFNLKDPRDLDAAFRLVFNGGWTHASTGAKPNGSNGYADTFVVPKNVFNATTFEHVSYYSRTNSTLTTPPYRYDLGVLNLDASNNYFAGLTMIIKRDTNVTAYYSDYGSQVSYRGSSTTTTNSLGLFIGSQTGNNIKLYKNNSIISSNTHASISTYNILSPLATRSIWIGNINELNYTTQNRWTDKESAFISIGEGLNDAEATALYTAVEAYQTSLGRGVNTPIYNNGLVLNLDAGNANSYPGTGTTWFDLAAGNNGTLVNGPTYDVNNGGSLSFSTNKYVTIPTGSAYNFGTSDFTIEGWVNLNSISKNQFLISKFTSWVGNLDFVLRFEFAFRRIFFYAGDGPSMSLQNSYNLVANTWYNYCISRVSGVTTFYLNGVVQSSHTGSVNIPNDKTDIRLGYAQDNGEPLDGRMSNFKVYNRGLSATEVLNNFNSTRGRFGL